jgi:hypothetical protein
VWGKKIERDLLRGTDVREFTAAAQQRKHEERMVRAMSMLKVAHANSSSTSWAHALHAVPLRERVCMAGVQHGAWQLQGHAAGFRQPPPCWSLLAVGLLASTQIVQLNADGRCIRPAACQPVQAEIDQVLVLLYTGSGR